MFTKKRSSLEPAQRRARLDADAGAAALLRMRLVALALLLAMAGLYALSIVNRHENAIWLYVRAFSEAAMVGGLADWFAVTALFRRPLGLPIPHTAIIPHNKGRIADALGHFVSVNFLAPEVVRARVEAYDIAGGLARQIADPATAKRVADGLIDALPGIVDLLDDDVVSDFLRRQLSAFSGDPKFAALIGQTLRLLTEHGAHQKALDAALAEGWRELEAHEPSIRAQVRARTSWLWRIISLDQRAADALISAIEASLREIARDPDHPFRRRVTETLNRYAEALQSDPDKRAQIARAAADVIAHPAVASYVGDVWTRLKEALRRTAAAPKGEARAALAEALERFGGALAKDDAALASLNRRLRALMVEMAGRHGGDIAALISDTIRGWDTRTVVEKLEQNIGSDLQYIRINGTLIGGLAGLSIHQITLWLL